MTQAIVIGGGILGAAVTMRLAERGAKVTLVEAGETGGGASRATFGWLNAANKQPRSYFGLNIDGMNEYRLLQRDFGDPQWMRFDGHVEWDVRDGGAARLREKVGRLREWGYTTELVPRQDVALIEPAVAVPDDVEEVAFYPQEGAIDAAMMIGAFVARAVSLGAKVRTGTRVARLLERGGRVIAVETEQGERLEADVVVSCTGSTSPCLLEPFGYNLPMAPTVGMVAVSGASTSQLRTVCHSGLVGLRPDGAGRVMMGNYEFDAMVTAGTPENPVPAFGEELLARATGVVPALAGARIESVRITTRPIPGDGLPVVGCVPSVEGLYLMVSHSGATIGPLLGRLAAREILDGVRDTRLEALVPDREFTVRQTPVREN